MNVTLSGDLEELVQNKVRSYGFQSPDEVVREALRLMDERDQFLALHKDEIKQQIAAGLESLRRGEGLDGEVVFDEVLAELDAMEEQ